MNKFPSANFDGDTIFSNSGTSEGARKGWESRKSGIKQALASHISGGEIDDAINSVSDGTEGPLAAAQRLYRGTSADVAHFNGLVQMLEGVKPGKGDADMAAAQAQAPAPPERPAWRRDTPAATGRVETYKRPYNREEWKDGRSHRQSFSMRMMPDGTIHDID